MGHRCLQDKLQHHSCRRHRSWNLQYQLGNQWLNAVFSLLQNLPSSKPANFSLHSWLLRTVRMPCSRAFDRWPRQLVLPQPAMWTPSDTNFSCIRLGVLEGRQTGWIPVLKVTSFSISTIAMSFVKVDFLNCSCLIVLTIRNSSGLAPSVSLPMMCS